MSTNVDSVSNRMRKPLQQKFFLRVKTQLLHRGMTITELAEKIGYKRNTVSLVIHERRKMPKVREAIVNEIQ